MSTPITLIPIGAEPGRIIRETLKKVSVPILQFKEFTVRANGDWEDNNGYILEGGNARRVNDLLKHPRFETFLRHFQDNSGMVVATNEAGEVLDNKIEQIVLRYEESVEDTDAKHTYEFRLSHPQDADKQDFRAFPKTLKYSALNAKDMYHLDKPFTGYASAKAPVWISTSWSIHTDREKWGKLFEPHHGTVITTAPIYVDGTDDYSKIVRDNSLETSITKQRSGDITRSSAAVHRAPTDPIQPNEIRIVVAALTGRGAAHVRIYGGDELVTNLKF